MPISDEGLKPCHTCRRRRRKCDRTLPACQKCINDGIECLGYGRLILWEQGLASRGKMMNKSFPGADLDAQTQAPAVKPPARMPQACQVQQQELTLRPPPISPFLQQLSFAERQYLSHHVNYLVKFYVLYDGPGQNPMREVMSTVQDSPVILHATVSNAAFHIHNLSSGCPKQFRDKSQGGLFDPDEATDHAQSTSTELAVTSFRHALLAKQKTLNLMNQMVQRFDGSTIDLMLATIVVLVNHELLEAGKANWKVHIEGAQKIYAAMDNMAEHSKQRASPLRLFCIAELLVLSILGTTLTYSSSVQISIPSSVDLDDLLAFTERYNYLSCPAPLLRLMVRSLNLPPGTDEKTTISACSELEMLIYATLAFEPREWSQTYEPRSSSDDPEIRFHIASALKSAVYLFLTRKYAAIVARRSDRACPSPIDTEFQVGTIVHHVSLITGDHPLMIATCWPVFLAGIATQSLARRQWVRERLAALWHFMHWGYICTAQEILDGIWESDTVSESAAVAIWDENLHSTYLVC